MKERKKLFFGTPCRMTEIYMMYALCILAFAYDFSNLDSLHHFILTCKESENDESRRERSRRLKGLLIFFSQGFFPSPFRHIFQNKIVNTKELMLR